MPADTQQQAQRAGAERELQGESSLAFFDKIINVSRLCNRGEGIE